MKICRFFVNRKTNKKLGKKNKKINIFVNSFIFIIALTVCFSGFYLSNGVSDVEAVATNKAIYLGNKQNNNVSFMFNVYSGKEEVSKILDILKENKIKATFFLGGMWANENEELVKRMHNENQEIGNHGYYHKDHKLISEERNKEEIQVTHTVVHSMVNVDMNLFAPPSGSYGDVTLKVAENLGYKTIMWSKDTIDWRDKNKDLIISRATKNLKNGDLILMHPTKSTVEALPSIIQKIQKEKFNIVSVSENIK